MSKQSKNQTCFTVSDFEERDRQDPELCIKLETALLEIGALSARVDVTRDEYCVLLEKPETTVEDLQSVFSRFGLTAKVKGKGSDSTGSP